MTLNFASILPVWCAVILGAVLVVILSQPVHYFEWLAIVFATAIIGTFVVQLAVGRKEGFVLRVMASVAGSALLLAFATAVLGAFGA